MFRLGRILDLIESCSGKRSLFIGDAIIDEYQYVEPLGKSPKENIVPVRYEDHEVFNGGTVAAARHADSFCASVHVSLPGRVTRKCRFVERPYLRKLFEVHSSEGEQRRCAHTFADYDVVIVNDFGHGAISPDMIRRLAADSKYLAVNAQTNSSNIGYNLITKYPVADYIVIDEPEARLAAADRHSPLKEVILKLAQGRCSKMIVTHGSHGATGWCVEDGFVHRPAFTDRVVDTMGAGDAFFAVTSLMAREGKIGDLIEIGNAAGAVKTQIVGHRMPVTKKAVISLLSEKLANA